jgi:hypothetical protein
LKQEELDYAEDLIFEYYSKNKLEKKYTDIFKNRLEKDQPLFRKYNVLKEISYASESERTERFSHKFETDTDDEQEEAALKEVMHEVIEKVYAEREKATTVPAGLNVLEKLKAFINELIPPINFAQPQLRFALVAVSIVGLAIIVWVSVDSGPKQQMANNEISDTTQNEQIADVDSVRLEKEIEQNQLAENFKRDSLAAIRLAEAEATKQDKEQELRELAKRERLSNLVAANHKTPEFEFAMVRSQTSVADELFVKAAENYNEQDYDSCILILKDLLNKESFKHSDTLNEVHFYLGNSYLTVGLKEKRKDLLELSLGSFKKVDAVYFAKEVTWYSLIANIGLGREKESKRLLENLIQLNYPENIEVFRDSVENTWGAVK